MAPLIRTTSPGIVPGEVGASLLCL